MNLLFDLSHPAHVHQFRNAIDILKSKGHDVKVTGRNKEVTLDLLRAYGIAYSEIGVYKNNPILKGLYMLLIDFKLYFLAKKFNPDILVGGVGNVYVAHVSFLLNKPSILFNDTEHGKIQDFLSFPFVSTIATPNCYNKSIGSKQVRYNGYHELAYLSPKYFTPNVSVLEELGLTEDDTFIIMRFVSWGASHDIGCAGLSLDIKRKAVSELSKFGRVLITSEKPLDAEFEPYRVTVSPEKMHDLLYYATLLYGESATMASECAVLGTHAIFSDFAGRGYTDEEEEKYDLVYNFKLDEASQQNSVNKAIELLKDPDLKKKGREKQKILLEDTIEVTEFMVNIIENTVQNK
ncbi:DUF354 domain-containing protein [Methanolobus profundi]|uniref:DUF354 domain-containing protein n=1 Tax=Methanolobus profundi TaxID=487685 RepID=A0A1I4RWJ0_9EURY|nr:DUF354 domain-containing protein [Methanolobus profundi]SFM56363.1 hypothetical protein SAMN04488696_1615 [Methanolobus profundi]